MVVPVRSTDWKVARSSPTRREYFVCNHRLAGARYNHPFNAPDTEIFPSNYLPYNRTIYGKPTEEVLNSYGVNIEASLISTILSEMKSIRDKNVGATIAYDAGGNATVVKMASYDRLGRKEKQWVIYVMQGMPAVQLSYSYNKYRPAGFGINGRSVTAATEYFKYDAAGNVWYDRHAKTAYKLNAAGLPEEAYIQNAYDANLTLTAVNSGTVEDIETVMYMNYDESGGRVWTRVQTAEMDLVAGSYRNLSNGKAYFPVTDAQGNVRGYANDTGLVSAYDYYAYGGSQSIGNESQVKGAIGASRYLKFHKDAITIHNHPGSWAPSIADFQTAANHSSQRHFIIQTNSEAAHINGLYEYGYEWHLLSPNVQHSRRIY